MKSVIILGAGTSIEDGISKGLWEKIKGKEIWSLNSIYRIFPSDLLPTRQLWVDISFFRRNGAAIQNMSKKGVILCCKRHAHYAFFGDIIQQYDVCREKEFYKEKMEKVSHIFIGANGLVGMFALSLAVREKFDIAYILGFDWGSTSIANRKTHCYQDKIKELNIYSTGAGNPEIYLNQNNTPNKKIKDFDLYNKEDCKIVNVSPSSHIYQFEKIDYSEFFKRIEKND